MKPAGIALALCGVLILGYAFFQMADQQLSGGSAELSTDSTSASPDATSTVTIMIGGDIMLDRSNRAFGEKNGYDALFAGIAPLLSSADIAVANLEGPITSYPSKTLLPNGDTTKSLTFTFATSSVLAIRNAGIDLLSLANNHEDNFGRDGVDETRHWLSEAGIGWFGDPANDLADGSSTENIACVNSICLAFVGYHEFEPGFEHILADIARLKGMGYPVIVMPHWGDEYASTAPARIKEKARELVQAGATAIIGSHPHVPEDREWIGDVPVIYSLGNLVFDQYFSPAVMGGNIAELTLSKAPATDADPNPRAHIDNVRLYSISNASHTGPVLVGEPIEFRR